MKDKKLLYFSKMDFSRAENLTFKNKIHSQIKAFNNLGISCDFLYVKKKGVYVESESKTIHLEFSNIIGFLKGLYHDIIDKVEIKKYDFIYIRHFSLNFFFLWTLHRIKKTHRKIKIFLELPSYPYNFGTVDKSFKNKIIYNFDQMACKFLHRYVDRIVTFSEYKKIYGIETVITENGIDTSKISMNPVYSGNLELINLVGVANLQSWHGFDRVIEGIFKYNSQRNTTKVCFHIIGSGPEKKVLEGLVNKYDLHEEVVFHGHLMGDKLDEILLKMQVAISSCGLHRVNLGDGEINPLKSREYCARGIPFVLSYKDRGFNEDFPYAFNVSSDDTHIEIEKVLSFFKNVSARGNYNSEMHTFAVNNFTWESKLKNVVAEFLKES